MLVLRGQEQLVPSRADPSPAAQLREPAGMEGILPGLGPLLSPGPPAAVPPAGGHGDPPGPFTWVPVPRAVRRAASALWQRRQGAASSIPGVTELD